MHVKGLSLLGWLKKEIEAFFWWLFKDKEEEGLYKSF